MDIPSRSAQIFCNSLYGLCPQPPPLNYTVPVSSPKPANAVRPAASKKDSIFVVHISDLHVDHKYTVGASYNVCTSFDISSISDNTSSALNQSAAGQMKKLSAMPRCTPQVRSVNTTATHLFLSSRVNSMPSANLSRSEHSPSPLATSSKALSGRPPTRRSSPT